MRIRPVPICLALLIGGLSSIAGTVGLAYAGDEIADSVAGVILDDGPEISGQIPAAPNRPKRRRRPAAPAPAAAPIWEQDGPPIDRAGIDGR
jgi:hypothetical protein